jgi:hypothetical protein
LKFVDPLLDFNGCLAVRKWQSENEKREAELEKTKADHEKRIFEERGKSTSDLRVLHQGITEIRRNYLKLTKKLALEKELAKTAMLEERLQRYEELLRETKEGKLAMESEMMVRHIL